LFFKLAVLFHSYIVKARVAKHMGDRENAFLLTDRGEEREIRTSYQFVFFFFLFESCFFLFVSALFLHLFLLSLSFASARAGHGRPLAQLALRAIRPSSQQTSTGLNFVWELLFKLVLLLRAKRSFVWVILLELKMD
jgi:hypothetical protein